MAEALDEPGGEHPPGSPPTAEPEPEPVRSADPDGVGPPADADVLSEAEQTVEAAAAAIDSDMSELTAVTAERDEYKGLAQRIQADFENYKKRVTKQQAELFERAAEDMVHKLLPVLDTADLAVAHDDNPSLLQLASGLYDLLFKEGLERLDPVGQPFDPTEHEAVMHEPGDGEPEVIEVMRAGYKWKGRVLRAAMVKVKG